MGTFSFEGFRVETAPPDAVPRCPACSEDLDVLWLKTQGTGFIEQKQVIMCPHCRAFLGYGAVSMG